MPSEQIQWFPGHMAKTRRLIRENLTAVDLVIEILDARIPFSSKNPEIGKWIGEKPVVTVLSKAAMADPAVSALWVQSYRQRGKTAVLLDCLTGEGMEGLTREIANLTSERRERYDQKGMTGRRMRAMIVGIPNVGKSSLINRIAGNRSAKVENRPGVTMQKQWVPTSAGVDLLDMPGVLWPKFEDPSVGENLAITGAIRDVILDAERIAYALIGRLRRLYPDALSARYRLGDPEQYRNLADWELAEYIGRKRGLLVSGGEVDLERTARLLIEEFRSLKIGRITLERPETVRAGEKEPERDV